MNELEIKRNNSLKRDLTDNEFKKLKCQLEPGRWVAIFWEDWGRKIHDTGYLLVTPNCDVETGDCFIHIVESKVEAEKDSSPSEWCHVHDLLRNKLIMSIED